MTIVLNDGRSCTSASSTRRQRRGADDRRQLETKFPDLAEGILPPRRCAS